MKKFIIFFIAIGLSGCALLGKNKVDYVIHADKKINPNIYNQPSPVVVSIYQLSSIKQLEHASFYTFQSNVDRFSRDIVSKQEIEIRPNQTLKVRDEISKQAKYIFIAGEFRTIQNDKWKKIINLDEIIPTHIGINLERNSLITKIER